MKTKALESHLEDEIRENHLYQLINVQQKRKLH